ILSAASDRRTQSTSLALGRSRRHRTYTLETPTFPPISPQKGFHLTEHPWSVMNDPSFAYGQVYAPMEIVEKGIRLLQTRLAKMAPEALTLEYLDGQYTELFQMLV